ncbi:MAG: hypothetical protein ACE5KE_02630 [Methanosarcinales archaeon]
MLFEEFIPVAIMAIMALKIPIVMLIIPRIIAPYDPMPEKLKVFEYGEARVFAIIEMVFYAWKRGALESMLMFPDVHQDQKQSFMDSDNIRI